MSMVSGLLGSPWGGLGLILVQFPGVLGWVGINFHAISGSPWAGLALILMQSRGARGAPLHYRKSFPVDCFCNVMDCSYRNTSLGN